MKYYEPLVCKSYYHIYNHAVGSENLFRNRENYFYFLSKFSEYIYPVCHTYVYCLLPNHFHFFIQVRNEEEIFKLYKRGNQGKKCSDSNPDLPRFVMQQFSNFFNAYAKAYNKKYDRKGALFLDYLKRKEVKSDSYFSKLVNYIHFNPVSHHFCNSPDDWEFSSYHSICSEKKSKIEKEAVLNRFGCIEEFLNYHKSLVKWQPQELMELEFV